MIAALALVAVPLLANSRKARAGWPRARSDPPGALVGIGRSFLSMETTLIVHAAGAPIGFALLTFLYQRRFAFTGPLATAAAFLGIVIGLDLLVVVPFFEKSFAMFRSPLGTWIPFALIFLATWVTSVLTLRTSSANGPNS